MFWSPSINSNRNESNWDTCSRGAIVEPMRVPSAHPKINLLARHIRQWRCRYYIHVDHEWWVRMVGLAVAIGICPWDEWFSLRQSNLLYFVRILPQNPNPALFLKIGPLQCWRYNVCFVSIDSCLHCRNLTARFPGPGYSTFRRPRLWAWKPRDPGLLLFHRRSHNSCTRAIQSVV